MFLALMSMPLGYEQRHHVAAVLVNGEVQAGAPGRVGGIDVGAVGQQDIHYLPVTLTAGIQQRPGPVFFDHVLRAAVRDQLAHHGGLPDSPPRLSAVSPITAIGRVDIDAPVQQVVDDVVEAVPGGHHQRGDAAEAVDRGRRRGQAATERSPGAVPAAPPPGRQGLCRRCG